MTACNSSVFIVVCLSFLHPPVGIVHISYPLDDEAKVVLQNMMSPLDDEAKVVLQVCKSLFPCIK